MPIHDQAVLTGGYTEASYAADVKEQHADMYHVFGSHYGVRIAFGNSKLNDKGESVLGRFHTAIYIDYKLAKDMISALQGIVTIYEEIYGSQDIKVT